MSHKRPRVSGGSPCVAYVRDDCVEVVDADDMRQLYTSPAWGCLGKGTVSRRQPNRAMVVPPELLQAWLAQQQQGAQGVQFGVGSDRRNYDEHDRRLQPPAGAATATLAPAPATALASVPASADAAVDDAAAMAYGDALTQLAHAFQQDVVAQPLPNAFLCAAAAAAHAHEPMAFETCRAFAHYISSPPPRLRHVMPARQTEAPGGSVAGAASAAEAAARASAAGAAEVPVGNASGDVEGSFAAPLKPERHSQTAQPRIPRPAVRFEHVVFETSIVEPEAAVYAMCRSDGRFIVLPGEGADGGAGGGAGGGSGVGGLSALGGGESVSLARLWAHFCARVRNFPARAAVYAHARDRGYVVRDGHAFGCDFELYPHGPGRGHGTVCIVIMPLQLRQPPRGGGGGGRFCSAAGGVPTEAAAEIVEDGPLPPPQVLAPLAAEAGGRTGAVMGHWLHAHAHGRVVGTVRKAFALAYAELQLPAGVPVAGEDGACFGGAAADGCYPPWLARLLIDPRCVLGRSVGEGEAEAGAIAVAEAEDGGARSGGPVLRVRLQGLARWLANLEHDRKKGMVLAHVAQAEAAAFAEGEGGGGMIGSSVGPSEGRGCSEAEGAGAGAGAGAATGVGEGDAREPPPKRVSAAAVTAAAGGKQAQRTQMRQLLADRAKDRAKDRTGGGGGGGAGREQPSRSLVEVRVELLDLALPSGEGEAGAEARALVGSAKAALLAGRAVGPRASRPDGGWYVSRAAWAGSRA